MRDTLRELLSSSPILLRLDNSEAGQTNGMLSLNEKGRFEFTWNGSKDDHHLVGEFNRGYVSFSYTRPSLQFFNVHPTQTVIRPPEVIYARSREMAERTLFDRVIISYKNFFTGFKHDVHSYKAVNILELIERESEQVNGLDLKIFLGGKSTGSRFPMKAEYSYDNLNIQLTGEGSIELSQVNHMLDMVTKVISLFIAKPVDPVSVQLGAKSERASVSAYDYALLEHSKPYEYMTPELNLSTALPVTDYASDLYDSLIGGLLSANSRELGIWFSYLEADYKKYYLDTILSILLSCAESMFYLLPKADTSKREQEFDEMLKDLNALEISQKLKGFIRQSRPAYIDPVTYETKISRLIKYSGCSVKSEKDFAKYLGQLRNNLMHGLEPDWRHIVDAQRQPVKEINLFDYMKTLSLVVSSAFKVHLKGIAAASSDAESTGSSTAP